MSISKQPISEQRSSNADIYERMDAATGKVDQPRPLRVLVVDDERNIRATLRICLEGLGCSVSEAATPERAIASISQQAADLAFVDLRLGSENGLDLIPKLLAENPGLDIVLITAYASFDTAVEGIKRGARDYLPKPFTPAQIRHVVERVQSNHVFFFNDTATTEIYTLSLHDALPNPSLAT